MKTIHCIYYIILTVVFFLITSCKDKYSPIYLVSVADHAQITDGYLELNSFSTGDKYLIRGGNGNYLIKNENETVVDYRYDGDTLSLPTVPETVILYPFQSTILKTFM